MAIEARSDMFPVIEDDLEARELVTDLQGSLEELRQGAAQVIYVVARGGTVGRVTLGCMEEFEADLQASFSERFPDLFAVPADEQQSLSQTEHRPAVRLLHETWPGSGAYVVPGSVKGIDASKWRKQG
jgi:hypothetical protein